MTQLSRQRNIVPQASLPISVLTIAGSDSGGGAGIQADLKTFAAHGVHGLSAITAVTAQNTRAVTSVHTVPPREIERQIDALFDDFEIGAVKLGMLGQAGAIRAVLRALRRHSPRIVVLDPVMIATSGARLLESNAVALLRDRLLPLATLVTPNLPEAEVLVGYPIRSARDMARAAHSLRAAGAAAALVKGGHRTRGPLLDLLVDAEGRMDFVHARLPLLAHGTGCTLAAAIAARLARGENLRAAVGGAAAYVHRGLVRGYQPGKSKVSVIDHLGAATET